MALRNGLLVHGPTHWAAAVRDAPGDVEVASGRKPRAARAPTACPGVRGVVRLGEAFAVIPLVKRALPRGAAAVPGRRPCSASRPARRSPARCCAATCAARAASRPPRSSRVAPALFALRGGELAAYHGVEHKSIARLRGRRRRRRRRAKEHERCGSHLVAPMLASNLAGTLLLRRALEKPARWRAARSRSPPRRSPSRCSRWCERNAETRARARAPAPGLRDPAR